jgi:lipopolysaccharide/colanic/teichoic acid biosynthesis glycosyltransferase
VQPLARLLTYGFPVVVVLSMQKAHATWFATPTYDIFPTQYAVWGLVYALILALVAYAMGLPDVPIERGKALGTALVVSVASAAIMSIAQLLAGAALTGRFVIFGSAALVVPVQLASSVLANRGHRRAGERDRVYLVGGAEEAAQLRDDITLAPERASTVVGSLEPLLARATPTSRPLLDAVEAAGATVLVLDRTSSLDPSIIEQAAVLHERGLRVRTLFEFYEEWLAKLPLSELERVSLFFDISEIHRVQYARTKRIIDVACAVVGVVPLAISIPFVFLGNLVANRGPLFFRQDRVGRGGQVFSIVKFRTMAPSRSAGGAGEWTKAGDPRITPFGQFMRVTHIDELPQVINILRGELSMVGPRPEQPHYVVQLNEKLPFYDMRHLVRPGLTGWAQVKYGYAADERDALEKLQYEFFYLRHQSVLFDVRIMFRTIRSTLGGEGKGR